MMASHRSSVGKNILTTQNTVLRIEQGVNMLHGMIPRLSMHNHNTVYIEDALGWTIPIILDANPSWDVSGLCKLRSIANILIDEDCPLHTHGSIHAPRLSRPNTCEIEKIRHSK